MVADEKIVAHWYDRAQVDYADLYMRLYIAYNAWFRKSTGASSDYEAIRRLCSRFVIWEDYLNGRVLTELQPLIQQIAILTHHRPLLSGERWGGVVSDGSDWKGLIYFWYQTRCDLFHGQLPPKYVYQVIQIKLAYESLNLFMREIMKRMSLCFTDDDKKRLEEVKMARNKDSELLYIRRQLEQKFLQSPDLWNVDMMRVRKE